MERIIFHIDVNNAYLSFEAAYRIKSLGEETDLRTIPSAVGGDISKRRGIILAKSGPAKKYGVRTGESIGSALRKCRELVLVPPHYDLYQVSSEALMNILREYSPKVEQYSIDEAFADMTGTEGLHGAPAAAAEMIKGRIYRELGFTVNIGISNNKLLAKMASDFQKPDRVHTLFPEEVQAKMWKLPAEDLFFVGPATKKKLRTLGITTIGELARMDKELLKLHLKKHGEVIHAFANGENYSPVEPEAPDNKGYGNSSTLPSDICDSRSARLALLSLCETVGARLRKDKKKISVVSVSVTDFEFRHAGHQRTLPVATNITREIHEAACSLFEELWDHKTPIRKLGVHTGRVTEASSPRQLDLFTGNGYEKQEKLLKAVDSIRARYGENSIIRASFLKSPLEAMGGGITPDRRHPVGEEVYYGRKEAYEPMIKSIL